MPYSKPVLLSARGVGKMLDIGEEKVRRLAKRGLLPAPFMLGRLARWRLRDIEAWINSVQDVNGKKVGDRGRVPWDVDPNLPADLLDLPTRIYEFPACESAVYFLVKGDKVLYVGQTTDLPGRISTHRLRARKGLDWQFDRVFYIPCGSGGLAHLEKTYIRQFKPPWNITGMERPE